MVHPNQFLSAFIDFIGSQNPHTVDIKISVILDYVAVSTPKINIVRVWKNIGKTGYYGVHLKYCERVIQSFQ